MRAHARSALFLSHSHSDHYCREVLALPFGETVLSGDFPASIPGRRAQEGESFSVLGLPVRAFGSTDLGLSYLVEVEGRRVFHAGDFNLWHWEDESTPQEIAEATEGFERILADLADCAAGTIDQAFFPWTRAWGSTRTAARCGFSRPCGRRCSCPCTCRATRRWPSALPRSTRRSAP